MRKAHEIISANPDAKSFEIGELLFAQFTCPAQEEPVGVWAQTDHLVHALTAKAIWKSSKGEVWPVAERASRGIRRNCAGARHERLIQFIRIDKAQVAQMLHIQDGRVTAAKKIK